MTMTLEEWQAEAVRRFGSNPLNWKFVCPVCKHVASAQDWKNAGAPENAVAFSCVGRWTGATPYSLTREGGNGPCNYAGGGLFRLNPVEVRDGANEITHSVFAFADPEQ